MGPIILRSELYQLLDTHEAFDLVFVSADRKRGTGGRVIRVQGWQRVQKTDGETTGGTRAAFIPKNKKDPRHENHHTINIYNPRNRGVHPHKVHFDLIQFFNGQQVIND